MARTKADPQKNAGASRADAAKKNDAKAGVVGKAPRPSSLVAGPANGNKGGAAIKKRRWHPGTRALREIRALQMTTNLLIPKAPFIRLVREIAQDSSDSMRFTLGALEALQESAEAHMITALSISNGFAIHDKRVTVMPKDVNMTKIMLNEFTTFQHNTKSGTVSFKEYEEKRREANQEVNERRKERKAEKAAEAAAAAGGDEQEEDEEEAQPAEAAAPKKRGRKPKAEADAAPAEDADDDGEPDEKAPAKRGRKPSKKAAEAAAPAEKQDAAADDEPQLD